MLGQCECECVRWTVSAVSVVSAESVMSAVRADMEYAEV